MPYRKRHKGRYLELIYAFIANIVPHARLCPEMPVVPRPLWNSIVRIDISYFRFTTHLSLPFSSAEEKWKSWNFYRLSSLTSVSTFRERFVAYLLPRSCDRKLKRRKKKKKNKMIPSILLRSPILFNQWDDWKIILREQQENRYFRPDIISFNLFHSIFVHSLISVLL